MSDQLKRNFMQQLVGIMNPDPVPVSRSNGVCADVGENISRELNLNGSIPLSLLLLVGKSYSLSPYLSKGLPAIDFVSSTGFGAYQKELLSGSKDLSVFKSLLEKIKEANAAADRAFAYVKTELANKGVDIKFGKDLSIFAHDKTVPTPAYFVLHHGDTYGITAETISINEVYIAWLEQQIFGESC